MSASDSLTAPPKSSRKAFIWLFAFVLGIGILTQPAIIYNVGDPYAVREEARNILLNGRLSVDDEVAQNFPSRGAFFVQNKENGRWYSRYGSFNGLLNTLPLAAEKLLTGDLPPLESPMRVFYLGVFFALLSAAIAAVLYAITGFYTNNASARCAFVLLAFYTTYLWNYLRSTTQESTQLLLLTLCYLCYLRFKAAPQHKGRLTLAWVFLLLLCQTKVSFVTIVPLFMFLLWRMARRAGFMNKAFVLRWMVLPAALICLAQGAIHWIKFGSPLLSGYHQFHDPTFPHTFLSATMDFLWGGQGSVFLHFPLLVVAAFGARRFMRLYPDESIFLGGCLIATYALVAPESGPWRGELAYGPRFFVPFLPLLALPAVSVLERLFASKRKLVLTGLTAISLFCALMQMEINRMDYFFKYTVGIQADMVDHVMIVNEKAPPVMRKYFEDTTFAKVNWDHLRACDGHWDRLPYYAEMLQHTTPENLMIWKQFVTANARISNLYWFPNANQ